MKGFVLLMISCSCFIFSGCITEYMAKGINEEQNILVVEGTITEGESYITLSRSLNLTDNNPASIIYVNNALVYIACDDGTSIQADESGSTGGASNGLYTIRTGNLNMERKYRLIIEIEEEDTKSGDCKTFTYSTEYANPIVTPEIDSVFWTKKDKGQPVIIHVATHDTENRVLYYRWTYEEEWEIRSDFSSDLYTYPSRCWSNNGNRDFLLGSGEKTVFGRLTDVITEFSPSNRKLEVLYRITVKQNVISKKAYDYYANIKNNDQLTGTIFAPIPSELRGNIICITEHDRPVIGHVDISLTTQKRLYILPSDSIYEYNARVWECEQVMQDLLLDLYQGYIPNEYVPYMWSGTSLYYILGKCIDCTYLNGVTQKPDDWPVD